MQYKYLILRAAIKESPFEGGQGDVKTHHRQVPLDNFIVDL
jgi:hypothetical protein